MILRNYSEILILGQIEIIYSDFQGEQGIRASIDREEGSWRIFFKTLNLRIMSSSPSDSSSYFSLTETF
jgi:hypothetical protein